MRKRRNPPPRCVLPLGLNPPQGSRRLEAITTSKFVISLTPCLSNNPHYTQKHSFVGKLYWNTDENMLAEHFDECSGGKSVRLIAGPTAERRASDTSNSSLLLEPRRRWSWLPPRWTDEIKVGLSLPRTDKKTAKADPCDT
ncbi:hypothetical protein BC830DRAFT_169567 [Chytriomyces sp. MP71]|nr:hypothetical protein BC830DRAFT_169567 [Chytriomyces sp. MP71]